MNFKGLHDVVNNHLSLSIRASSHATRRLFTALRRSPTFVFPSATATPPPLTPPIFLPSSAFNWISFFVPIPRLRINSIVHGHVAHRRNHPLRRQLLEFSITIRESRGLDHQVMKMSNALSWSASSIDTDTERKATELKKRTAAKIHKKIERWYTNLTLFALTNF